MLLLALFEPGFEFRLLCSLPQLQLPDSLVVALGVRVRVLLSAGVGLGHFTKVLQVEDHSCHSLDVFEVVPYRQVLVADAHSRLCSLLEWRAHQLSQGKRHSAEVFRALGQEPCRNLSLFKECGEFRLRRLEFKRCKSIEDLEFAWAERGRRLGFESVGLSGQLEAVVHQEAATSLVQVFD